MMYNLVSFVVRGKNRRKVLSVLDKPMTPTDIAKSLKIDRPSVSRSLIDLKKKGIVKCLTPKEKTGRLYEMTSKGKGVLKRIK